MLNPAQDEGFAWKLIKEKLLEKDKINRDDISGGCRVCENHFIGY